MMHKAKRLPDAEEKLSALIVQQAKLLGKDFRFSGVSEYP
jgi:hypothetical protein